MLLAHRVDGNLFSVAIRDGYAKQFLRRKDAPGTMAQSAVICAAKKASFTPSSMPARCLIRRFRDWLARESDAINSCSQISFGHGSWGELVTGYNELVAGRIMAP
jgi:hypothetical protein